MRESHAFAFILTVSRMEAISLTHGTRRQSVTHYDAQHSKHEGGTGGTAVVVTAVRSQREHPSTCASPRFPGGRDIPPVCPANHLVTLFQFLNVVLKWTDARATSVP